MRSFFRKWGSHIAVAVIAFGCGADACGFWVMRNTPLEERPAMHLSDNFGTLDDRMSSAEYVSFFVGGKDRVWGEVVIPQEVRKNGFNQIFYTANNGERLMHANVSAHDGWHQFQILDWDNKTVANIYIGDGDSRGVLVNDGSGKMLATGVRSADTGAITLQSPEGMQLATIAPTSGGHWDVNIANCSKISRVTYALLAGYETMISTGRATSI
jgi:hypothetical protein